MKNIKDYGLLPLQIDEHGIDVDTGIPELKLTIDYNHFDGNGYFYIENEKGEYINTGLKHNPAGFRKDGTHIITGKSIDIRGFNIFGKCLVNNSGEYDKNGFRQDGRARNGTMYIDGYNAYGVNQDGLNKKGVRPNDCIFAEYYIIALRNRKSINFLKKNAKYIDLYKSRLKTDDESFVVRYILYKASLMDPKIKERMCQEISSYQEDIKSSELRIKELKINEAENRELIERLENEIKILKMRIAKLDLMQDL